MEWKKAQENDDLMGKQEPRMAEGKKQMKKQMKKESQIILRIFTSYVKWIFTSFDVGCLMKKKTVYEEKAEKSSD